MSPLQAYILSLCFPLLSSDHGVTSSVLFLGSCCSTAVKHIFLFLLHHGFIPPDAASVILRTCDYGVATVIKSTRKYIVFVPVQYLLLNSCVGVPYSACLVTTGRDNLVALWVELNFRYLVLVTLEKCSTSAREYIIYPGKTISRCRC